MFPVLLLGLLHAACALLLARHLWQARRLGDIPLFAGLSVFLTFYGLPIAIGFASGLINTLTILLSAALTVGLTVVLTAKVPARGPGWREAKSATGSLRAGEWCLLALLAAFVLGALLVGRFYSITTWDAADYHALGPTHWAHSGQFEQTTLADDSVEPVARLAETAPNSKGILLFLILSWTGVERGSGLVQWPFLLIACAALYSIARRMELPRWSALLALLFLVQAPEIWLQSIEAYADVQYLAGLLALIAMLAIAWREGVPWRTIWLTAAAFALVVSSKPNGLPQGGLFGILFLVILSWRATGGGFVARAKPALHGFLAVVVLSFLVAGPWYLHAWRTFGNPLYPIRIEVAGHVIFPGRYAMTVSRDATRQHQGASGIRGWWQGISESDRLPSVGGWSSGLGAHAFLLGLPAIVVYLLLLPFERRRWESHLPVVLLFLFLWLTNPVKNLPRFGMYQVAAGALAFSWLCASAHVAPRVLLLKLLALLMVFNVYRTLPSVSYRLRPAELALFPMITGHWRGEMQDTFPDSFRVLDWWREVAAGPGTRLAIVDPAMKVWWARPLHRGASAEKAGAPPADTPLDSWHSRLAGDGFTHLYVRAVSPTFQAVMERPDLFRLVLLRRDSGMETPLHMPPPPTEALVEVIREEAP